ncbi:MAG: hypothetical protein ACR2K9_02415 [Solirubrobacteraceae bacterium]
MADSDDGVCAASPPAIAPHPRTGRPWLVGTPHEVAEVARALEAERAEQVALRLGLTRAQLDLVDAAADRLDR